jgi:hypothetical protein
MKLEQKTYPVIDAGTYAAHIDSIELGESTYQGKTSPRLTWSFELDEPIEEEVITLKGWTGIHPGHPKATLTKYLRGLLGEVPQEVDTDDLIGMPCRVVVTIEIREDKTEKNKILNLLPAPKGGIRRPKPEMVADEQEIPF